MDSEFKKEVTKELENLERLIREMKDLMDRISREPDFIVARAAGSILHDFYCGVEKIFKRIALNIDNSMPRGEDWHIKLLLQMAQPMKDVREAIINPELLQELKEYLRFRHLFRNIYGFELKWERIKSLCSRLDDTLDRLKIDIKDFMKKLLK